MTTTRILPTLLFLCLCTVAASAQTNPDARRLFNDGNRLLRAGAYDSAAARFDAAIAIEPHEYYWYQKGLALRGGRRFDEAQQAFSQALAINPSFAAGYNALAGGFFAQHRYDSAVVNYRKALELVPMLAPARTGLASALAALAVTLLSEGGDSRALDLAREAVRTDPKLVQGQVVLAQACNKTGAYADALAAATAALALPRSSARAAACLEAGIAHRALGSKDKARAMFLEARKDPRYTLNADYELKRP